ncbi:MAG: hypothetical protein K2H70_00985 [Bacteroidales bacterium]|nr:hypothetical protein [Bacteroidales bacterium]
MPAQAQWSDNPKENTQLLDQSYWNVETLATSDGGFYMLTVSPDSNINRVTPILHYFDKDGLEQWDNPVKFKIDSTMSWTKVMSHLYVDKDDNAIVIGQTLCDANRENYTIWKVDKAGKQLWGEDGVDPHDGKCPEDQFNAAIRVTQMEAGNYIFVWMGDQTVMQNISADGKLQWGDGKRINAGAYPHVMDAGDGDILLVYESTGLNVRRLDFEGNTVWDVKAFSGQLNTQIPSWTYVHVYPVDDPAGRGVLISYYGFVGDEHYSYISYVKADGTHAFPDADAGLRVCYSENWGMSPALAYDDKNKAIYAIAQERAPGTNFYQRIVVQKISESGELQWGNEGIELIPVKERTTGYECVAMGPDGNVLFGFMENVGLGIAANDPIHCKAAYMKPDGSFIWEEEIKTICAFGDTKTPGSVKYNLEILPYANEQWICVWEDCRVDGGMDGIYFGQNLYWDGSMGPVVPEGPTVPGDTTANEDLKVAASALRVMPNPVYDEARIAYTALQDEDVRIDLVGTNGLKVMNVYEGRMQAGENTIMWRRPALLTPGLYLMQLTAGDKVAVAKILLQ